jgi:hypothetical protein
LFENTADENSAFGARSLESNTTGTGNTAIGTDSLGVNTIGVENTAVGNYALGQFDSGSYNTAIGARAMSQAGLTGGGNIQIGGMTAAGVYSPCFSLATTHLNRIVLGSASVTDAHINVPWTVTSDSRDKIGFGVVPHGLDFVSKLDPVSYQFRANRTTEEANGPKRYGFKAQDILALEGEDPVIINAEDPELLRMNETQMIPVLVNAIKELRVMVEKLKDENAKLTKRIDTLENK